MTALEPSSRKARPDLTANANRPRPQWDLQTARHTHGGLRGEEGEGGNGGGEGEGGAKGIWTGGRGKGGGRGGAATNKLKRGWPAAEGDAQ